MLKYCPRCKEKSVRTKLYRSFYSSDSNEVFTKRVEYCINKGCGYNQELPSLKMEKV